MRAGIWLVGARGSVAATTVAGALALRAGLAQAAGCVTAHPALHDVPLLGFGDLTFGGITNLAALQGALIARSGARVTGAAVAGAAPLGRALSRWRSPT